MNNINAFCAKRFAIKNTKTKEYNTPINLINTYTTYSRQRTHSKTKEKKADSKNKPKLYLIELHPNIDSNQHHMKCGWVAIV